MLQLDVISSDGLGDQDGEVGGVFKDFLDLLDH